MNRRKLRYWWDILSTVVWEYRVPLVATSVGLAVLVSADLASLPDPPGWMIPVAASASLLSVPGFAFAAWLAKKLHPGPATVSVGVADPGSNDDETTGEYTGFNVAPEVWDEKDVNGYPPLPDPEGPYDYLVTRFSWYESINQIEVRGCEWSDMTPGEAWQKAERVDEYYQDHHVQRRQYSRLKATVQRFLTEVHDATLLGELSEQEDASLIPDVSVSELVEEMEEAVEGLPDGPAPSDGTTQQQRAAGLGELDEESIPDAPISPHAEPDDGREPAATDGGEDRGR